MMREDDAHWLQACCTGMCGVQRGMRGMRGGCRTRRAKMLFGFKLIVQGCVGCVSCREDTCKDVLWLHRSVTILSVLWSREGTKLRYFADRHRREEV